MTTRLPPQCPACGHPLNREAWTVWLDYVWCDNCIDRTVIDKRCCIATLQQERLAVHVTLAHGLHIFTPREPRLHAMNATEALRVLCNDRLPTIIDADAITAADADELLSPQHASHPLDA